MMRVHGGEPLSDEGAWGEPLSDEGAWGGTPE